MADLMQGGLLVAGRFVRTVWGCDEEEDYLLKEGLGLGGLVVLGEIVKQW